MKYFTFLFVFYSVVGTSYSQSSRNIDTIASNNLSNRSISRDSANLEINYKLNYRFNVFISRSVLQPKIGLKYYFTKSTSSEFSYGFRNRQLHDTYMITFGYNIPKVPISISYSCILYSSTKPNSWALTHCVTPSLILKDRVSLFLRTSLPFFIVDKNYDLAYEMLSEMISVGMGYSFNLKKKSQRIN